ncbi:hypothetical protein CYLTODRAFT_391554 [Cylindrobasidium torrendii FP15055 ss-10]|uniref:VLRF1 domain-containing protein n=1 Tax=Cylindrobasidium torrendii FP15055 ss-10 TaxID=1314674 RepID=A0A0D7BMH8_9AGAR|nr:hypothetical protein CYLTODRAFT_391554 [Cylindrobasidium torrendii FP15055 ss-10]
MQSYHIFSLPSELLETLTPRHLVNEPSRPRSPSPKPIATKLGPTTNGLGSRACNICNGAVFQDTEEQRSHYRSDWHRYNVKTRLNGHAAVSEADFAKLVDTLDDSLSGSESSSDESDDSDAVNALVSKNKRAARPNSPEEEARAAPVTALTWFHSPPSTQIGIYRMVFPAGQTDYLRELKAMQSSPTERTWALFMTAGGHFAGAIVRVAIADDEKVASSTLTGKKSQKGPKPEIEVLRHKTFHRYTTRRKQGGSQGTNDNAKTKAVSAGAMLRRYGEMALRDDIRGLIEEWKDDIGDVERIWIRASVPNRKIFMDYEGSAISKTDSRLRTFPFPTRRPTQAELTRCLNELVRVKVSHLTEDALREQDEAYLASLPKPKAIPTPAPAPVVKEKDKAPVLSKEEELLRDRWERLLEMLHKGKVDAIRSFWEKYGQGLGGVDTTIPDWAGERYGTLLQVAAAADQEDIVRWLLEEARANPTLEVTSQQDGTAEPSIRRTAYDLSASRNIRDTFRRVAGEHTDWWDWFGAGKIPSALSKEMEEEREEKKKTRRKGLKDKLKEREKEKKTVTIAEPESTPVRTPKAATSGPQKLGGGSGAAEAVMGLTPEMRARIERERRARAAEARMAPVKR